MADDSYLVSYRFSTFGTLKNGESDRCHSFSSFMTFRSIPLFREPIRFSQFIFILDSDAYSYKTSLYTWDCPKCSYYTLSALWIVAIICNLAKRSFAICNYPFDITNQFHDFVYK